MIRTELATLTLLPRGNTEETAVQLTRPGTREYRPDFRALLSYNPLSKSGTKLMCCVGLLWVARRAYVLAKGRLVETTTIVRKQVAVKPHVLWPDFIKMNSTYWKNETPYKIL
jgi:hypothetical protein